MVGGSQTDRETERLTGRDRQTERQRKKERERMNMMESNATPPATAAMAPG